MSAGKTFGGGPGSPSGAPGEPPGRVGKCVKTLKPMVLAVCGGMGSLGRALEKSGVDGLGDPGSAKMLTGATFP